MEIAMAHVQSQASPHVICNRQCSNSWVFLHRHLVTIQS